MEQIFIYIGLVVSVILISLFGGVVFWSMDPTHTKKRWRLYVRRMVFCFSSSDYWMVDHR